MGKTSLARLIARLTRCEYIPFSAVMSGIKEIKAVMTDAERLRRMGRRTIVFIDEIHRFNKAQQDALAIRNYVFFFFFFSFVFRGADYVLLAALVGRDGSIDWLCWPAFDSDACFAALLGEPKNGRWLIAPAGEVTKTSRRYWDNTLILETLIETADGVIALIDFMPPRGKASDIVRLVRGISGRVQMRMELVLRFGFGADIPWVKKNEDGSGLLAIAGRT